MTKKIAQVLTHPNNKHLKKVRLEDGTIVLGALDHNGLENLTCRYLMGEFEGWDVRRLVDGAVYLCVKGGKDAIQRQSETERVPT